MNSSEPAAREKPQGVRKALLLGCVVALLGAACGQRGPLYLPQPEPRPVSQPAAPTAANGAQNETGNAEEDKSEEEGAEETGDE